MNTDKVIILGLDGATFDVIFPLIKEGVMPNLKKIIERGSFGVLKSVIPPVTAPAWLSIATGLSPSSLRIFDFLYFDEKNKKMKLIDSSFFKNKSLWDYTGEYGMRAIVINYPFLYPPYEIEGIVISGFPATIKDDFAFPKYLKREIFKIVDNEFDFIVNYHHSKYDDVALFLNDIFRTLENKYKIIKYLLTNKRWEMAFIVISETDWFQHRMWKYINKTNEKETEQYDSEIKKFWIKIDEIIGFLNDIINEKGEFFIISDHGFGPNTSVFKINYWLEKQCYLKRKKECHNIKIIKEDFFCFLTQVSNKFKFYKYFPRLYKWGKKTVSLFRPHILDEIDWQKTIAFDPGHTIPFGGIYLNKEYLENAGIDREKIINSIIESLRVVAKEEGFQLEIFKPFVNSLDIPDIIISINNWGCVLPKNQFGGKIYEDMSYSDRHTGSHRLEGIFIAKGRKIKRNKLKEIKLMDILPTILYALDIPIPSDVEGRVLKEIFTENYLNSHPMNFRKKNVFEYKKTDSKLSLAEDEKIKRQLEGLGYM